MEQVYKYHFMRFFVQSNIDRFTWLSFRALLHGLHIYVILTIKNYERSSGMNKHLIVSLLVAAFLAFSGGIALAEHKSGDMADHHDGAGAESSHTDVTMHQDCRRCGMDRGKFAYSRMLITYSDGSSVGVCSLHCAVTEMKANKGKKIRIVEAADFNTGKLVAAEKAVWVIGGSRKGVMTQTPKWAFAKKDDAVAFIKKNGGKLATYNDAINAAEID
jgi:nitrous oxide reductase accessory protein NosL